MTEEPVATANKATPVPAVEVPKTDSIAEQKLAGRKHVMSVYALLASLSLLLFGSLQILVERSPVIGYVELAGALAVAVTMLLQRFTGNLALARACFLLTLLALLVAMLFTGGTQGTGIFWLFMFPVAAFFLAGKQEGVVWAAALFVVIGASWGVAQATEASLYYTDIVVRQLVVTLVVISIGLYVYERSRVLLEARIESSQQLLASYVAHVITLHDKIDHAKSEFVTLASHQLRTPISAIGWSSELLLGDEVGRLKNNQREYVQGIYDSNRRLETIVEAMLLVSSIELGKVNIKPEAVDLKTVCHQILSEELKKYADKHLIVHEAYAEGVPIMQLDMRIIQRILRELISNAVKYTPPKGSITISIAASSEVLPAKSKGSVAVTVSDNGYGIPEEEQQNVFAKLFRAANVRAIDTDGTGLGLYIVKALVDQTEGRVEFASKEDEGSSFTVVLPLEGMAERHLPEADAGAGAA